MIQKKIWKPAHYAVCYGNQYLANVKNASSTPEESVIYYIRINWHINYLNIYEK